MNNKLTMLLAASALVVGAQSAKALTFEDADNFNPATTPAGGVLIAGGGGSYSDTFNISTPDGTSSFTVDSATLGYTGPTAGQTFNSQLGFNTATDTIVTGSGAMGFWFRVGPTAKYNVTIEDITLSGNGNGTTLSRNVLLQNGLSVKIEADLQASGQVTYTVSNVGTSPDPELLPASVRLDYAYLQIDATRQVTTTPDGGATAMLLGLGALGVAGLRRKLS